MIWNYFVPVATVSIVLWLLCIVLLLVGKNALYNKISFWIGAAGTLLISVFLILYWIDIARPPMRTMAETRLWYSVLVSLVCLVLYKVYQQKIMLVLGMIMASVFLIADIIHPEYQHRDLMPALQSAWFIPHVVVYMISYAILGTSSMLAIAGVFRRSFFELHLQQAIQLVYPGFLFLTFGMLLGAFWAKFAWADYWAWDPKEIWALATWLFYLLIIHLHRYFPDKKIVLNRLLVLSFAILLITWLGIKYLPSATQSVHVYGN